MVGVFETPGPEQAREVGASIVEMNAYFDAVIEERRRRRGDDLLSVLVRAEVEQGVLTPREAQTFAYTLLVAGSVTTTYLLSNALLALLRHPAELEKLWAEPALVPSLVEEALRYDPPVHVLFRTATRDTEIAGVAVPRESVVVPRRWSAPCASSSSRTSTSTGSPPSSSAARAACGWPSRFREGGVSRGSFFGTPAGPGPGRATPRCRPVRGRPRWELLQSLPGSG